MASSVALAPLVSKQWSCSSLLRGQSLMMAQKFSLDENMSLEDKIAVPCHEVNFISITTALTWPSRLFINSAKAAKRHLDVLKVARPRPSAPEPEHDSPVKNEPSSPSPDEVPPAQLDPYVYTQQDCYM